MKFYCFHTDEIKLDSKFIAFYINGSGGDLFSMDKDGAIRCADGDYVSTDWLLDASFCLFAYLPKKFLLHYEIKELK
jgi:hypothetical protein